MQRTILDNERHHFDFGKWCSMFVSIVGGLDASEQAAQYELVHDMIYDARQIVDVAIWCSSSAEYTTSYSPHAELLGATLRSLGFIAHFTDACEALENNARALGMYIYETDNEPCEHIPATAGLEDTLNLAKDICDALWEQTFEDATDDFVKADSPARTWWRPALAYLEKTHPLPSSRPIHEQKRTRKSPKELYEELCASMPEYPHIPYEEAVGLVERHTRR